MDSSHSERSTFVPSQPNELHGWKDIAAYLGKSVRAAQRWESELGLPVHRLKTAAGQSIFARRDEIDAWRARQEVPPPAAPDDEVTDEPMPARWPSRHAVAAVLSVIVLGAIATTVLVRRSTASAADAVSVSYRFSDTALIAETESGRVMWEHSFGRAIEIHRPVGQGSLPVPTERIRTVDLDGDGVREVLAVVSTRLRDGLESDQLYCFSNTGAVRWVYRPELTERFGAGEFAPPWLITAFAVTPEPAPAIYVAASHHVWWPSVLLRIDANGRAEPRFVQSGQIYAINFWTIDGTRHVVTGGINNEYASAAVAVLPEDGPLAHSPQAPGSKYACRDCGDALPRRYFVFAPMELSVTAEATYNRVVALQLAGGAMNGLTQEAPMIPGADSVFRIDADLATVEVNAGDGYWVVHRHFEEAGRLHHRPSECPERHAKIRIFDPARGWHQADLRFTAAIPGSAQ